MLYFSTMEAVKSFPYIHVLPVGGLVVYDGICLRMVRLDRPETSKTKQFHEHE
jgi:hypothetical protein